MRLLFDECVEVGLAATLSALGHDEALVQNIEPGADDERVMDLATAQNRLLVAVDKDLGELALRRRRAVPGIILLRIPLEKSHLAGGRVASVLSAYGARLSGHHTVIQENRLRIRPLRAGR